MDDCTESQESQSVAELQSQNIGIWEFPLQSLTTIQHNTVIQPLIVSPSTPMIAEVEANILLCHYEGLNTNDCNWEQSWLNASGDLDAIVHQVIMLDELATEHQLQWDDSTDKFQGSC